MKTVKAFASTSTRGMGREREKRRSHSEHDVTAVLVRSDSRNRLSSPPTSRVQVASILACENADSS